GHVSLASVTLTDLGHGKTKLTNVSVFESPADRDSMIKSGMEDGLREGYERLDELVEKTS
ncbi:MAG: ATPase, partial [Candidatus Saccharimonadales bacterium]